ncbi:MAG: hypothetical protein LWX83_15245 [Anaerolineae bacterium]|nr:hypothetical protein [Anaerolineae bacterium]
MYESEDNIPVRDWVTLGVILLLLIVVVTLGVLFAEQASSSETVVHASMGTSDASFVEGGDGQKESDSAAQPEEGDGQIAPAKGEPEMNQVSFFQVFGLLLVGSALFAIVVSVLIAALIVVGTRLFKRKTG